MSWHLPFDLITVLHNDYDCLTFLACNLSPIYRSIKDAVIDRRAMATFYQFEKPFLVNTDIRHYSPILVQEATGDAFVGVDAAVAEEGPVLAGDFDEFGVEVGDEDLFFVVRGLG